MARMRVGIIGAGPIAQGCAALLADRGHQPMLWSPRGRRFPPGTSSIAVRTTGLLELSADVPLAQGPAELAPCDVLMVCVLGNGHRRVMEAIAPYVRVGQVVIVSSHCSLGALFLSRLLALRGVAATIAAWATTVIAGPLREGVVQVRLLRGEMDVAALPAGDLPRALEVSRALCGERFAPAPDLLAVALSNLNPPVHMANALLNFTRMERAEVWPNYGCITAGVGRLVEALDAERLAVAAAFGHGVRSAREHMRKSTADLPADATFSEMAQIIESRRAGGSPGPASAESRYVTEDVPFGIHPLIELGRVARVPTPLHAAGLALLNAVYGRDFAAENDLLPALGLEAMDAATLQARCRDGWA
jgi:opine dehydrogenase